MTAPSKTDIVITGVGGQGTLLVTQILGEAALRAGLKVTSSEIHGMAQRGGVVVTTVRIGDVWSPLVADGDADVLIGFEPVETLREISKASPSKTLIITNTGIIQPFTVSTGAAKYPDLNEVLTALEKAGKKTIKVEMEKMARDNNFPVIAANIIMLGVLMGTGAVPIPYDTVLQSVEENVPSKFVEENRRAFQMGYARGKELSGI